MTEQQTFEYSLKAKELGIPVVNEVEVAYHYIDESVKIIGITGSNGKTTTTSIIYEIMKRAFGDKVILAGNIGIPLSYFVSSGRPPSALFLSCRRKKRTLQKMSNYVIL